MPDPPDRLVAPDDAPMPVAAAQLKLVLAPALNVTTAAELSLARPSEASTRLADAPGVTSKFAGNVICAALLSVAGWTTPASATWAVVLPVALLSVSVSAVEDPV